MVYINNAAESIVNYFLIWIYYLYTVFGTLKRNLIAFVKCFVI